MYCHGTIIYSNIGEEFHVYKVFERSIVLKCGSKELMFTNHQLQKRLNNRKMMFDKPTAAIGITL